LTLLGSLSARETVDVATPLAAAISASVAARDRSGIAKANQNWQFMANICQ
jgi:hypothetical protein